MTLDISFCLDTLERALLMGRPEIFTREQGVQFTSQGFTRRLEATRVSIRRDGQGRALDNIFVERF